MLKPGCSMRWLTVFRSGLTTRRARGSFSLRFRGRAAVALVAELTAGRQSEQLPHRAPAALRGTHGLLPRRPCAFNQCRSCFT